MPSDRGGAPRTGENDDDEVDDGADVAEQPGQGDGKTKSTFAETLRDAVSANGLSLDRLHERLTERGVKVSVATLSYWKSGRSLPGRRTSFETLAHLEDMVGLAPGALASLVPPRAHQRRSVDATRPMAESMGDGVEIPRSIAELDARLRRQIEAVSEHAIVTVGPDRTQRSRSTKRILRALSDGVDRLLVAVQVEDTSAPPTRIVPLQHCALGRWHWLEDSSFVITELLFDRRLAKDELMIIEYRLDYGPPFPYDTVHEEHKQMPLRDFVLEVDFDPAAVPVRCEWYESSPLDPYGAERVTEMPLSATNSVVVVRQDVPPSQFGLRWFWEEPAEGAV